MAKLFNGAIELASAINQTGGQPLDDRVVVKSYSDLINPETFGTATYLGMCVSVIDDKKLYVLVNPDKNVAADKAWKAIGGTETVSATDFIDADTKAADLAVGQLIKVASPYTVPGSEPQTVYAAGFYIVVNPAAEGGVGAPRIQYLATSTGSNDEIGAIKSRLDTAEGNITSLQGTVGNSEKGLVHDVKANTDAISKLNGTDQIEGSVANAVKALETKLVGGAKEGMDTFKEVETKFSTIEASLDGKVANVTGLNAIDVTKDTKSPVVSLKLDETGNVSLSQTESGLKADVTIETGTSADGSVKIGGSEATVKGWSDVAKSVQVANDIKAAKEAVLGGTAEQVKATVKSVNEAIASEVTRATAAEEANANAIKKNTEDIAALSSATHFIGKFDVLPGTPEAPEGVPSEGMKGDVVIVGNKEYIYNAGEAGKKAAYVVKSWVELGDTTAEGNRILEIEKIVNKENNGTLQETVKGLTSTTEGLKADVALKATKEEFDAEVARAEKAEKMAKTVVAQGANITVSASEVVDGEPTTYTVAATGLATTETVNGIADRITAAEGSITTLTGTEEVVGSVKKAEADAKAYADGLNTAMDTRVQATETKLAGIEDNAQANKIESVKLNSVDLQIAKDKSVNIEVSGKNINVGDKVNGEVDDTTNKTVSSVLADIYSKLGEVKGAKVSSVAAVNDNEVKINTSEANAVTIDLAKETIEQNVKQKQAGDRQINYLEHNIMIESSTNGLYASMYYDGDDVEKEPAKAE